MIDTLAAPVATEPMTDIAFAVWVGEAAPGDRLEYHRGFLCVERKARLQSATERRRLTELANAAHEAFEAGLVHLVQQRIDADRFAYIAIARPKPRAAAVPQSQPVTTKEAA